MDIKTPPLKYHGSKFGLAKWIHSLAPPSVIDDPVNGYTHRNIAFAGGLGEFWNWSPVDGISEAVNDVYQDLYNFYHVLKTWPDAFLRELELTPFSEDVFCDSIHDIGRCAPIRNAVHFFVKYRQSRQGLGKDYATPTRRTRRGMNENVSAWLTSIDGLADCHERLRRVEIRNMDAIDFIRKYDHSRALFYLDCPYLLEARVTTNDYKHEMSVQDHNRLLNTLGQIEGKFLLSGYDSELYQKAALQYGWREEFKTVKCSSSSKKTKENRTEVIWMNY